VDELPDAALRRILDELEANRRSRRTAWATLERLRKFLEENGATISTPENRTFETEGEAIERGLRRTIEYRDGVTRNLIRAVYRFRDTVLVDDRNGGCYETRSPPISEPSTGSVPRRRLFEPKSC
jgi:hypothetical protein